MVKMWFTKFELKEVVGAGTLEKICNHCGNVGEHTLTEAPYGLGIGIPLMRPFYPRIAPMLCDALFVVIRSAYQKMRQKR
jgi:hypothetical protein